MGKIAFVFPGQGSQKVGMGQALAAEVAVAKETFAEADEALGESLSTLCFEGPEDALRLTENTQPAILTASIALYRALDRKPDLAAGHSLGEYSAHVAAGTLDFAAALRLCRARGRLMQAAVPVGEGAMAAVLKADAKTVEEVCAATEGVVEPANYNCPGQLVIAGAKAAVEAAAEALKARGARCKSLPVSAPFHSSLMRPAEDGLAPELAAVDFRDPNFPVYVNVDAEAVTTAAAARDALHRQVSRPVRWEESIEKMVEAGVTLFVEIGPGKVLTGLNKRIAKDIERTNLESGDQLEAVRTLIDAHRG